MQLSGDLPQTGYNFNNILTSDEHSLYQLQQAAQEGGSTLICEIATINFESIICQCSFVERQTLPACGARAR